MLLVSQESQTAYHAEIVSDDEEVEESQVALFPSSKPMEYAVKSPKSVLTRDLYPVEVSRYSPRDMQRDYGNSQESHGDEKSEEEAWERRVIADQANRRNESLAYAQRFQQQQVQAMPQMPQQFLFAGHQPMNPMMMGHLQQQQQQQGNFPNHPGVAMMPQLPFVPHGEQIAQQGGQQFLQQGGHMPLAAGYIPPSGQVSQMLFHQQDPPHPQPMEVEEQFVAPPSNIFRHTSSSVQSAASRRESVRQEESPLGVDFTPGPWHVLCGRSKHNFDHIGNRRLRILVANKLKAYVEAPTRRDKSDIISEVASHIRDDCHGGGFVRKDRNGQWTEVGPTIAREKVSHAFRDSLLKQNRRREGEEKQSTSTRQRTWREAQNEIFSMLHLYTESTGTASRRASRTESQDRRTSATSTATGMGSASTGTATRATTPVPASRAPAQAPIPEAYMNQYRQLQEQNRLLMSQLNSNSLPIRGNVQQQGDDPDGDNANDNDQIQGNLARRDRFPWP